MKTDIVILLIDKEVHTSNLKKFTFVGTSYILFYFISYYIINAHNNLNAHTKLLSQKNMTENTNKN